MKKELRWPDVPVDMDLSIFTTHVKSVTIEGWVARDANPHSLYVYGRKPSRFSDMWGPRHNSLQLDPTMFPKITWKSEPKKVKITITPIE